MEVTRHTRSRARNNENDDFVMLYISSSKNSKSKKFLSSSSGIRNDAIVDNILNINSNTVPEVPIPTESTPASSLFIHPATDVSSHSSSTTITKAVSEMETASSSLVTQGGLPNLARIGTTSEKVSTVELRARIQQSSSSVNLFTNNNSHILDKVVPLILDTPKAPSNREQVSSSNAFSVNNVSESPASSASLSPFSFIDSSRITYFIQPPSQVVASHILENTTNRSLTILPSLPTLSETIHNHGSEVRKENIPSEESLSIDDDTCPICLESLVSTNIIITPCCEHSVCLTCIYQTVSRRIRRTCFLCHHPLTKIFEDTVKAKWLTEKRVRQAIKRRTLDEMQKFKITPTK